MFASLALLLACYWVLGRVLRGAVVGAMASRVQRGQPTVPLAFTVRRVPVPAGEELLFAARASLWTAAGPATHGRQFAIGRRRMLTLDAGTRRVRYAIAGRERRAGGLLVVTHRRVLFRGGGRSGTVREDVPLGDVAHLQVEGPLLVVERRSRPTQALVVRVATPVPVARLVAAAAAYAITHRGAGQPR